MSRLCLVLHWPCSQYMVDRVLSYDETRLQIPLPKWIRHQFHRLKSQKKNGLRNVPKWKTHVLGVRSVQSPWFSSFDMQVCITPSYSNYKIAANKIRYRKCSTLNFLIRPIKFLVCGDAVVNHIVHVHLSIA